MKPSRHRASALLLAAFQIAAAATVPVADAILEIGATSEPVHIEAARDTSCGDGHDHVFCQLCRTLALGDVPREVSRSSHAATQTVVAAPAVAGLADRSVLHASGPVGPRAPPLA